MILKTERLLLRPWREEDAEDLYQYARDPEVGPPAGWPPHTSVENSREIIHTVLSAPETFAVCLQADGKPIGSIGLHRNDLAEQEDEYELGYWIGKPFWGQGLIPEAAREMLRYAFCDLGMKRIWCGYYDGNVKSRRVMDKLGFVYQHATEGIAVELLGEIRTGHVMLQTKEDWEKRRTVIETERLRIREYTVNDFDGLYEILSDRETMQYYPKPYDADGVRRWIRWCLDSYRKNGFGLWALELKDSGRFIGDCGISMQKIDGEMLPEIGYHVHKAYWRQGYAKEACKAVKDWLFENTSFDCVYSSMNRENIASCATAAANGMTKRKAYTDGEESLFVYSITRSEWLEEKY